MTGRGITAQGIMARRTTALTVRCIIIRTDRGVPTARNSARDAAMTETTTLLRNKGTRNRGTKIGIETIGIETIGIETARKS